MPDELEVIPDSGGNRPGSNASHQSQHEGSGEQPIPRTMVEKVDPLSPSHGEIPGTAAHALRKADAVPDVILQAQEAGRTSSSEDAKSAVSSDIPIPKTVITKVDSDPSHGEVPGTDAFDMRKGDAKPDLIEKKGDISSKHLNALLGAVQRANDRVRFTNICE